MANNNGWDIPKRYLRVRLYQDKQGNQNKNTLNWLTEDVRVQFDISAAVTGAIKEANITISGMQVQKMFAVATNSTLWVKDWLQHRIVITAGYYGKYATVFDGTVIDAAPNLETADYSITIKAVTGFQKLSNAKSYNFPGPTPISTIAATFAADNNWGFVDGLQDNSVTITDYAAYEQNVFDQMRMLTQMLPIEMYVENERLYLKPRGRTAKDVPDLTLNSRDIIGIPRPTQTGCKVKVRMNPWVRSGQQVKLNSTKYPELNTINFWLDSFAHAGDTYGSDWFTEIQLTKDGLGYYKNE